MGNPENIKKYQFKPGVSGNPGGRPAGKSMKTYAQEYLAYMSDEDRIEFLNSIDPEIIWKMSEGNPLSNVDLDAKVTKKIIGVDE